MGVGLFLHNQSMIMTKRPSLSRRDFLRLAGTSLGAFLLPVHNLDFSTSSFAWPIPRLDQLPYQIQEILDRVPRTMITRDGRLYLMDSSRKIMVMYFSPASIQFLMIKN